ncbi:MAG: hypothetical protein ABW039_04730 [Sphingobium sp.]
MRCISPPPQDIPLAFCDARTASRSDEVIVTAVSVARGYGDFRHDTLGYTYSPDHR